MPTLRTIPTTQAVILFESRIAMMLDATHCLLADGRQASLASSCLLVPEAGDTVLVSESGSGNHVLHVLCRADNAAAVTLSVADAPLILRGRSLNLQACEQLDLVSGGDTTITAVGSLALNARNLFATVSDSLVQQSRHFIAKAGQYLVDARHLLKLHGQDALITAERDIKADAERISMG